MSSFHAVVNRWCRMIVAFASWCDRLAWRTTCPARVGRPGRPPSGLASTGSAFHPQQYTVSHASHSSGGNVVWRDILTRLIRIMKGHGMSDPQTKPAEPTPVVLEIRKLDKLETTYVRNCSG